MEEIELTTSKASVAGKVFSTLEPGQVTRMAPRPADSQVALLSKTTAPEVCGLHSEPLSHRAGPQYTSLEGTHMASEALPSAAHSQLLHHLLPQKAFLKGSGNQQANFATTAVPRQSWPWGMTPQLFPEGIPNPSKPRAFRRVRGTKTGEKKQAANSFAWKYRLNEASNSGLNVTFQSFRLHIDFGDKPREAQTNQAQNWRVV